MSHMIRAVLSLLVFVFLLSAIELSLVRSITSFMADQKWMLYTYVVISILGYLGIFLAILHRSKQPLMRDRVTNFFIGVSFAAFVQKVLFGITLVLFMIAGYFVESETKSNLLMGGFLFSFIPFALMLYGTLWGKYRYQLEEVDVYFDNLPAAFENYKIVQITDIHSGTWDSVDSVDKGIKLIEKQDADMIVFTGDLVNSDKDEIDPFIHLFERLKAPDGKYAVLGNHDYVGQPRDRSKRPAYFEDLFRKFKMMGFDLIMNDSREIRKGNDIFKLIGVENWGSGRFFPKRGDLDIATDKVSPDDFTILLSHDPSHWNLKALDHRQRYDLTLSGHTHGMQFGINLPFFKWSPVQYRYKYWMGLYKVNNQQLYVNRGFGLLAFPGRVGMSPEVAVIRLKSRKG